VLTPYFYTTLPQFNKIYIIPLCHSKSIHSQCLPIFFRYLTIVGGHFLIALPLWYPTVPAFPNHVILEWLFEMSNRYSILTNLYRLLTLFCTVNFWTCTPNVVCSIKSLYNKNKKLFFKKNSILSLLECCK
jgi:hypothetical protein